MVVSRDAVGRSQENGQRLSVSCGFVDHPLLELKERATKPHEKGPKEPGAINLFAKLHCD
jgi:hypothetical protein